MFKYLQVIFLENISTTENMDFEKSARLVL